MQFSGLALAWLQKAASTLNKGTYCAGMIKTNRTMFPKELIPETTMELGSFRFASADKPKKLLAVC